VKGASERNPLPGNPKDEWRAPEREHLFCGSSVRGLPSGDPEGQGRGLRGWMCPFTGNS
jgi:hypothetical protein